MYDKNKPTEKVTYEYFKNLHEDKATGLIVIEDKEIENIPIMLFQKHLDIFFSNCIFTKTSIYGICDHITFSHCLFRSLEIRNSNICNIRILDCNTELDKSLWTEDWFRFEITNSYVGRMYIKDTSISDFCIEKSYIADTVFHGSNIEFSAIGYSYVGDITYGGSNVDLTCEDCGNFGIHSICPETGSFIGYKQALDKSLYRAVIIKLEILEDAKRSSAFSRKCRCSKAKVLEITNLNGSTYEEDVAFSNYDSEFAYRVGDIVYAEDFQEDRTMECAEGIHFFLTRKEAVDYMF